MPSLEWCPDWNGGVDPTAGDANTSFSYCVAYIPSPEPGNDPWSNPPRLAVWKGGEYLGESDMSCEEFDIRFLCYAWASFEPGEYAYQFAATSRSGLTVHFPDPPGSGPTVA